MSELPQMLVAVAGNIGSGKTSLANYVAAQLGWAVGHESVSENVYLKDFYSDQARWAFHLAMYNLEARIRQQIEWCNSHSRLILDRSIYEDRYVFVEMQRESGLMSERDYQCYISFWDRLIEFSPTPDVVVYIKAPISKIMERISDRGREIESGITFEYLDQLEKKYETWIKNFDLCPVKIIDGSLNVSEVGRIAISYLI